MNIPRGIMMWRLINQAIKDLGDTMEPVMPEGNGYSILRCLIDGVHIIGGTRLLGLEREFSVHCTKICFNSHQCPDDAYRWLRDTAYRCNISTWSELRFHLARYIQGLPDPFSYDVTYS